MAIFTIKTDKKIQFVNSEQIINIVVEDYICSFLFVDGKKLHTTQSLAEVLGTLPKHFIQINRSCVVNVGMIDSIDLQMRKLILKNGIELLISCRRFKLVKDFLLTTPDHIH
jgi:DNA-binding LytR/AlgR family response regulator